MVTRPTRRRGAELDNALLAATWEELLDRGYENLTMEAVAVRAGTSRPVIARRWPDRASLAIAAIRHSFERNPLPDVDTGTLRGDLLAILEVKAATRASLMTTLPLRIAALIQESGVGPLQFFEQLGMDLAAGLEPIWERAAQRGEVDLAALHPRIRILPFALVTVELSYSRGPLQPGAIAEILDVVVLPLVPRK